MKKQHHTLLILDGIINLILGILLLLAPFGTASFLGVPEPVSYLYTCVLGGVLIGIGIALILEARGESKDIRGLGVVVILVGVVELFTRSSRKQRAWDHE